MSSTAVWDRQFYTRERVSFQGDIAAQGKLLFHGLLKCTGNPGTGNKLRKNAYSKLYVFLFERSVIFTRKKDKKKKSTTPFYVYKTHISVSIRWYPWFIVHRIKYCIISLHGRSREIDRRSSGRIRAQTRNLFLRKMFDRFAHVSRHSSQH